MPTLNLIYKRYRDSFIAKPDAETPVHLESMREAFLFFHGGKQKNMTKSDCYKHALLDYHVKLTQSAVIR